MKQLFTLIVSLIFALQANAQVNPQRVVIRTIDGRPHGFLVEHIDSLFFPKVEGEVKANVTYKEMKKKDGKDIVVLDINRTENCPEFRIALIPKVIADNLGNSLAAHNFFEGRGEPFYGQDFSNGELDDISFVPNAEYTLFTLGYDTYRSPGTISRADFVTPKPAVTGSPSVEATFSNVTPTTLTVRLIPNTDCKSYIHVLGTAEMVAQTMRQLGIPNTETYIKSFGKKETLGKDIPHKDLKPSTEYTMYVLPIDVNGVDGSVLEFKQKTAAQGGSGVAQSTIEIKESSVESGSLRQRVVYTPNDQTNFHIDIIMEKNAFESSEWGEAKVVEFMKTDEEDKSWGVDDVKWTVKPQTAYYALSIAQNANGEWGPLTKVEFTTPQMPANVKASISNKLPFGTRNQKSTSAKLIQP